jgi:hypothetical protein
VKHHSDTVHFLRFGLIGVFLIAVLAIVGIVALVTGGSPTAQDSAAANSARAEALAQMADAPAIAATNANAHGASIAGRPGSTCIHTRTGFVRMGDWVYCGTSGCC